MIFVLYIDFTLKLNNYHINKSWSLHSTPGVHDIILILFYYFFFIYLSMMTCKYELCVTHSELGQYVSAGSDSYTDNCAETKQEENNQP